MRTDSLLFELGTEELPPTALPKFIAALEQKVCEGLEKAKLSYSRCESFAAPRRLALLIHDVPKVQPDQTIERRGPAVKAAFPNGRDGEPSKAAEGFARSCGTTVNQLEVVNTDKGECIAFTIEQKGEPLAALITDIINTALDALPIPKRMRWGNSKAQFVRPVHWAVLMHGETVIDTEFFSLKTGNTSLGHRFHHPEAVMIKHANDYEDTLRGASVVANFDERKADIKAQIKAKATELGGTAKIDDDLLNEVTALVELPVSLAGQFEERFLDVPQEALISTMESNQKYFTVLDSDKKLLPWFITISNIQSKDESKVIQGNERVVRPRLADAAFFFETDKKKTLAEHGEALVKMVFQNQLGTLADKSMRISTTASKIAGKIGADVDIARDAGALAKADLVTDMVYEFTSLQGTMGYYYATNEGLPANLAKALYEQYLPRYSGDDLPETKEGMCLALADKLDSLVGIIGIGQIPTGDKDPFALRRASLGIMRMLIEKELSLSVDELVDCALTGYAKQGTELETDTRANVLNFFEGRYRAWYQEQSISLITVQAVQATGEKTPVRFDARVKAVAQFQSLPEAEALAASNKRVSNILAKSDVAIPSSVNASLLQEDAEKALWQALSDKQTAQTQFLADANFTSALNDLASLKEPVDTFFDSVMVNAEDVSLKNNRLALLSSLQKLFTSIADISKLAI